MIQQGEHILFIAPGNVIITVKQQDSIRTGCQEKTVVVTTKRILFFESLANQIAEIEYQVITNKKEKKQDIENLKVRPRISINAFPEYFVLIEDRQAKIMIDQQPTCLRYFEKIKIKRFFPKTTGLVVLKNPKKFRFQLISFSGLKQGFRFCKAILCARGWIKYQEACKQTATKPNRLWARLLIQIISHQSSLVLVDPDLFIDGSMNEIKNFIILILNIPFARSFHHRYAIVNPQAAQYCSTFIQNFHIQTHSLNLSNCKMKVSQFQIIFNIKSKLSSLMQLNLQKNELTDNVFKNLTTMAKKCNHLSNIDLSYNLIMLTNQTYFLQFLKTTQIVLTLNMKYNKINDNAVPSIQKFILFSINPPIEQLDLSFNLFSKKASWRLFISHAQSVKIHTYFNFIIYPIPFKKQIFNSDDTTIDFPRQNTNMNFNIHSALIQQFNEESLLQHSFQKIQTEDTLTIRLQRQVKPGLKIPKNKHQVAKILEIANQLQNFIYSPATVQNILTVSKKVAQFPYQISPLTKKRFIQHIEAKLNQALFIRDHYSVKFILESLKTLNTDIKPFIERLNRLQLRDNIFKMKADQIFNFNMDQQDINQQLDDMVKQGLRLYLEGNAIDLLYYLKYLRDKWIWKLHEDNFNPDIQLAQIISKKNYGNQDRVNEKNFVVPYEIKVQKLLNENFYLHPWQTDYVVLSEMNKTIIDNCVKFLQTSDKKDKFALYFERIEQRINFIKNQFNYFFYHKFKISLADLKINPCRLLFMYNNILQTSMYVEIPIYIIKRPINTEQVVKIINPKSFKRQYHISNYRNICKKAKIAGFYNYPDIITRYESQGYKMQVKTLLDMIKKMFITLQKQINLKNKAQIGNFMIPHFQKIKEYIRKSSHPEQLKEQFYLHIIGWRKGKHSNNTQLLQMLPFFTMYLKPPLVIEKFLVTAILENQYVNLAQLPLCLATDVNKPTSSDDVQNAEANYIERDWWINNQSILSTLIMDSGIIQLKVYLLNQKMIALKKIPQSSTILQIVKLLINYQEVGAVDSQCFWLYLCHKQTTSLILLESQAYLGQILSQYSMEQYIFMLKRRIYAPQFKFISYEMQNMLISSLFYDIKYEYLKGDFFLDEIQVSRNAAILMTTNIYNENARGTSEKVDYLLRNMQTQWVKYIPQSLIKKLNLRSEFIIDDFKAKLKEILVKNQHKNVRKLQVQFLEYFSKFPEFASTNYIFLDQSKVTTKLSINSIFLFVQSANEVEKIYLEQIIKVVPKKFLFIQYHKNGNFRGQLALFSNDCQIRQAVSDILSYCALRIRMSSSNLYNIVSFQKQYLNSDFFLNKLSNEALMQYKRLCGLSLSRIKLQNLIHACQPNKFIKSYTNRKLYANKTQKKLDFKEENDDQQLLSGNQQNFNIFNTIFPQLLDKDKRSDNVFEDQNDELQDPKQQENIIKNIERDLERQQQDEIDRDLQDILAKTAVKKPQPYVPAQQEIVTNSKKPVQKLPGRNRRRNL